MWQIPIINNGVFGVQKNSNFPDSFKPPLVKLSSLDCHLHLKIIFQETIAWKLAL